MEAKEGKDLLILFGQWMFIKSRQIHSKASTNTLLFRWWAEMIIRF